MKAPAKQPEYTPQEAEAKIRKYGKVEKVLYAVGAAGAILAISSLCIYSNRDQPKIAVICQNAQATVQELQGERKNLSDKLKNYSYTTPEIEDARNFFNKEYNEGIHKLNRAIKSAEVEISKMESDLESGQYQQDKGAEGINFCCSYFGGCLAMFGGGIGGLIFDRKKRNLEGMLKGKNSK